MVAGESFVFGFWEFSDIMIGYSVIDFAYCTAAVI